MRSGGCATQMQPVYEQRHNTVMPSVLSLCSTTGMGMADKLYVC